MKDMDSKLKDGNKAYGAKNARPFKCTCGGTISQDPVDDYYFECDDCGQRYEKDDWRSDRLKPIN